MAVGYAANATAAGVGVRDLRVDLDLTAFLWPRLTGNAGFDSIRASVHIDSDATSQQLAMLHEQMVGVSPVGHTLRRAVPVSVRLA